MTTLRLLPALALLAAVLIGCGSPDSGSPADTTAADTMTSDATGPAFPSWSYEGETEPAQWADLSVDYAACAGDQQSPIDLTGASSPTSPPTLQTSYAAAPGAVFDTGHAIQVNTTGGTLTFDGTTYELAQFHVHAPSEHTVDGSSSPAEIHFVHQTGDSLAVLGVFVEEGSAANPALDGWIQGDSTTISVNASDLLPETRSFYTYRGSLTTPPCSEIVRWVVLDTPIEASAAQLETLRAQHDGNARPVQPLGDRTLRRVSP
jgi:carbonic anhydrase